METSASIIARVLNGDREAFRDLVAAHQDMLLSFAGFRLGDPSVVEEVVQQTFIRAYAHLAEFERDGDFGVWLRVTCHYVILHEVTRLARERDNRSHYRDQLRVQLAEDALGDDTPGDGAADALAECLRRLPGTSAALVRGKYADGRSLQDLASEHGHTVSWVTTTLHRLRLRLRECIEQRLGTA